MPTDLTFKQVCEFIKKDDSKLIDDMGNLLGLALVYSPVFFGPAAVALLPMISVKNELVKLSKRVFEAFTSKEDNDYFARQRRMEIAYGLICFTAFFEALDQQIPEPLRNRIGSLKGDENFLAECKRGKNPCSAEMSSSDPTMIAEASQLTDLTTSFPHPAETFAQQIERHMDLWRQMSQGFREFAQNSVFWEQDEEKEKAQILAEIEKIPQVAAECFEAQYFELVRRYEDFAVWANLQEHKMTKELIGSLSEYVQQQAALSKDCKTTIDIGFERMHEAVLSIPETLKISQATEIVQGLKRHYDKMVTEPIAEGVESQGDKMHLCFPKICNAFIPQSFRVLRWTNKVKSLEDEAVWKGLERRVDLGSFLLSYLSSPYSTEAPLVVLGHPGSGKSLLTKVLSAQLMSKHYTVIRVPLREVDADASIVSQIEEQIHRITGFKLCWADFSSAFKNSPPLVILDGYDELLQASGKVFSNYLKDVQIFQNNETVQGRPVRMIVTSRITLIDKATIPPGATIIRLLEFDKRQRDRWISIWNKENVNYFKEVKINEFSLPIENEDGAAKILSLAEQPLLLLMLALYDSEGNQLRKNKSLDRTILYDSLLRRFVKREKDKDREFKGLEKSDQKDELDLEMQRLSVAALGMYNRRKLHILSSELNEDIKFFAIERSVPVNFGRPLTQADLLLGSFFFVHKSKAQVKAGASENYDETASFEFLHNTFGEFLTAEFIIRQAIDEVVTLKELKENEALHLEFEKRLRLVDAGLSRKWFASLVYTPLFTRPVVLEMMREWIDHALKSKQLSREEFLSILDTVFVNQIKRLLSKREFPPIIWKEAVEEGYRMPFEDHPLLGHVAIYSINLILLRIIVADEPFVFDERLISTYEDGARPWDRLTHIWRSWFALDNLSGLTAVMLADRFESQVTVQAKKKFQVAEGQNRLKTFLNVSVSLGDNISSGLAGLLLFEPSKDNQLGIEDIARRLGSEKIDVEFQIAMKGLLQNELLVTSDEAQEFITEVKQALEMALQGGKREEIEYIALSLRRVIKRLRLGEFGRIIHPKFAVEVSKLNPQAALVFYQLAKEEPDPEWNDYFINIFLKMVFRLPRMDETMKYDPETLMAQLQVVREIKGEIFLEQMDPKFLEHAFNPRYLLELSERNPEAALVFVQLVKEAGGEIVLRRMDPKFLERAFDPRYLLELSERNPEAALAWVQLLREVGGERFQELMDPEFLERVFDPRYLLKLSERNPEAALAWVQLAKVAGGERFQELMDPEFLERVFDPRYLLELSERNPEAALVFVQLVKEAGGEIVLRRMDPKFLERAFDPRYLLELSKRNPEVALAWVQLLREVGGEIVLRPLDPKLLERVFKPRYFYLLRLSERNPEAALAWVQLLREVGGERFQELMDPEFLERVFKPRYLLKLSERNPEVALAWVQLAKEVKGERFIRRMDLEFLERVFDPRYLLKLSERNPEVALAWVQLMCEFGAKSILERYGEEIIDQWYSMFGSVWTPRQKSAAFIVPLSLARITNSPQAIEVVLEYLVSSLRQPGRGRVSLETLPLATLSDLQWLAKKTDSPEINSALSRLLN